MIFFIAACTPDSPTEVTWDDVRPIAEERCAGCHQSGGIAGFLDLTDGAAAEPWAAAIELAVSSGRMPPFPADGGSCEPAGGFEHDPRLTAEEKELMLTWAAAGAPLGEESATYTPPNPPALEGVSATLVPESDIRIPPASELADLFMCVLLDPAQPDTVWLDGFEMVPEVSEVAHHITVYRTSREEALLRDHEDGAEDGVYPCFGGADVANARLVAGWIPGSAPLEYPPGSGVALAPDELLVAQIHYHGIATETFDQTEFRLRWQTSEPADPAHVVLLGNPREAEDGLLPGPADRGEPEFRIPANATDHTERFLKDLGLSGQIQGHPFLVIPHMHLVGTGITVKVQHEDGTETCLVDVPAYDFDWQLFYQLDPEHPDRITSAGDSLSVECRYDNSMSNSVLSSALLDLGLSEPIDVSLGQGTLDEMCTVGIGAVARRAN